MITPQNLVRHELIGLCCKIVDSADKKAVGVEGKVIDETRNVLTLEVNGKEKSFVKEQCVFLFSLPSGEKVKVEGALLVARPEDRIKKKLRKW